MLRITKIVRPNDEEYQGEWRLTAEQMNFLLTYAINMLVVKGLAEVEEKEEPYVATH